MNVALWHFSFIKVNFRVQLHDGWSAQHHPRWEYQERLRGSRLLCCVCTPAVLNDGLRGVKARLCLSLPSFPSHCQNHMGEEEEKDEEWEGKTRQAGRQAGRCLRDNGGLSQRLKDGDNACGLQSKNPFAVGMERVTEARTPSSTSPSLRPSVPPPALRRLVHSSAQERWLLVQLLQEFEWF